MSQGSPISFNRDKHRVLADGVEEAAALIEAVRLAAENGAEIEAETVDLHLGRPVAQRIQHHLQHARMRGVDRVSGAGVVDVVARLVRHRAVIGEIVDALERKRRPLLVAFRGMVVDDVQYHFQPGVMKSAHHVAEAAEALGTEIASHRREEAERVVAPVVAQTLLQQMIVVGEPMDRHQFDRGHAEALDIGDHVLVQPSPRTCLFRLLGHCGMQLGEAAHVRFVDDRRAPADAAGLRAATPSVAR